MSTKTAAVYGFGVNEDDLKKITMEKLVEFLQKYLPSDYNLMVKDVENQTMKDYEEWMDVCSCINSGIEGKYSIISTAMSEKTGIRFVYHSESETGACAIMIPEMMPWQMNRQELRCTEEYVSELFKKYFTELGIDIEPRRVCIEYFGL